MKIFRKDCKTIKDLKRQKAILYLSIHIDFLDGVISKEDHQRKASRIEKAYNNTLQAWRN
jgi:hypothetical protein